MNTYEHRKGKAVLKLVRPDGTPVSMKEVVIRQTRHKFLFGCAEFAVVPLANDKLQGEQKERISWAFEKFLDLFNFATLPFYWGRFEPVKGQPQTDSLKKAAQWLKDRGCVLKGHPLCWHTLTAPWLLEMTNAEILDAQLARIRREVSDFAGLIDMWDVINEVVIMPVFDKYDNGITRICKEMGRIPLVREVFKAAREANPRAILLINDFNISEAYAILIEGLLEAGVTIDAIGIQSHMHQGYWGVEKTLEVLERFSRFNLPIHFTETTLVSGHLMPPHIEDLNDYKVEEWPSTPEGEERQAQEAVLHYKTLFAWSNVEAITWWNFLDGGWLNAPAGFITKDGRVKPIYHELYKLIKGEWWTGEQRLVTDDDGLVTVEGYLGDYEISCMGQTVPFTLHKDGSIEIRLA